MIDINGDGLPGIITASGGHLDVAYNTGDGFLPQVRFMNNAPLGESVSMSVSRFGNVGVAIPAFLVKIIIRFISSSAQGVSRTSTALIDINGDGYPDYVRENGPNELKVRYNLTGRTNLEKPLYFDPFGQIEFAPVGHNIIAPCKVLVQGSILFYPFRDSGFS